MIDPAGFRRALQAHFDHNHRPLPWRTHRNPYRILVSEFMLQQTRVETVVPYYDRWLKRFPGFRALADAPLDEVILAWKGLGYYTRARNLHRTAQLVRDRHGGELPEDPAALRTLPGIGEYTAGAVASIAFGTAVPAVDGNVRRVLARLLDLPHPTPAQLRRAAARLLDTDRPGDHNEAMMELGATICTPRTPRCGECPVTAWCAAHRAGTVARRPAPRPPRPVPRADYATVVALDPAGRTLLAKRPKKGLLAGMWEFPSARLAPKSTSPVDRTTPLETTTTRRERAAAPDPAATALEHLAALGYHGHAATSLPPVQHAFTHLRVTYHPVVVYCDPDASTHPTAASAHPSPASAHPTPTTAWVHPTRLDEWALPVAQQKIGALLSSGAYPPRGSTIC